MSLTEPARAMAQQLLDNRDAIVSAHRRRRANAHSTAVKIRHHGDFHLGQVLIAKDDAYILDFEGEPGRTLAERRRKEPPARDVAGFIRSIDYATSAARRPRGRPQRRKSATALAQRIARLGRAADDGLLGELLRGAGTRRIYGRPTRTGSAALLDLFLLEKALYEIEYELTNRPGWTHIPLEAMLRNPRAARGDRP